MLLQTEGGAEPRVEAAKAARGLGAGIFEFRLLLIWGFPAENGHRNTVGTAQIALHLLLKISERIEAQIVVEAFLIVSVASLNFAIVPRCSRTNKLMLNFVTVTEHVKRMNTLGVKEMSKFCPVVSLNDLGSVTEKGNSSLHKVYGRITAVFFICIDKTLS